MRSQLLAVPHQVRDAAADLAGVLAHGGPVAAFTWQACVADLGRHYAWPWWNTLTTAAAREAAGPGGPFWVAAPDELWRLVGRLDGGAGVEVEWLSPVIERLRFSAGRQLAPGEFVPGDRVAVREVVTGVVPASMTLRQAGPEPSGARQLAAAVVEAAAPSQAAYLFGSDPVGVLAALVDRLWRQGGFHAPSGAITHLGVGAAVAQAPGCGEVVASAAAVGFLAAHGQVLPPPQLPVPADEGASDWPELLVVIDLVWQAIETLLTVVRRAPHLGGWISWRIQPSQPALPFAAYR